MERPPDMYDRDHEWSALARFASDRSDGALLGIVSGRRRQGKSFLLDALCERTGGFYYEALEGTRAEQLRHFGRRLAEHIRAPAPLALPDWSAAVDALLRLGRAAEPAIVCIDEFPYLSAAAPELPSALQQAFGPRAAGRRESRTRLALCGSAISVMGRLLSGTSPLRGRASLELVVQPFDYREAAGFWGLGDDPWLAAAVHAVVGGTPAYGREFVRGDRPRNRDDFDEWVCRAVLDPSMPLFREGRYLLAEEPGLAQARGLPLYQSVLGAIAAGHATHRGIAGYLGRPGQDVSHVLHVLEDVGFVVREEDAVRRQRPTYVIAEPFLRFYHAVMRPRWGELERPGAAPRVWHDAQPTFWSNVVGPAFEELCRQWVARHAAVQTIGGSVARVARTTVNDRARRRSHEVDVVALGARSGQRAAPVLSIGEAKWGTVLDRGDLARLDRVRELLEVTHAASGAKLLACSGAGFTRDLRAEAARRDDVELVDLHRLYHGA